MRCSYCRVAIPAGKEYWHNAKPFCSRTCREITALKTVRAAGFQSPWYLGLAAILAVFMLSVSFSPKARAHDPNTHQANELSNARSKHGGLCCNGEDYTRISTWERTDKGYRIHFGGQWVNLPREAEVNNMHNPDGEAKAWVFFDENGEPFVRCFMRGAEG